MTDEGAFLEAIAANRDDDTVRLVFADWLDENDQEQKARYLRHIVMLVAVENPLDRREWWNMQLLWTLAVQISLPEDWLRAVHGPRYDRTMVGIKENNVAFLPRTGTRAARLMTTTVTWGPKTVPTPPPPPPPPPPVEYPMAPKLNLTMEESIDRLESMGGTRARMAEILRQIMPKPKK